MSNIESIFKAVEFIEQNLKEEIRVADIADAVCYSLYHFCRMFNRVVHYTPYDYLMRRRLSESARELVETDKRIIDIAFDYQFNSPETYSRAFKRMFGMQPYQWKKQRKIDRRFFMSRLTFEHIKHINKGDYLRPLLEEKDRFQVAGLVTLVRDDRDVISKLWEMFARELESMRGKVELERYYGIRFYPEDWEESGFFYMVAMEITSQAIVSAPMVMKRVPPLRYARFIHKGALSDLRLTLDYIYQIWLPKSGKSLSYPLVIENHGRDFRCPDSEESERDIYIPVH